MIYAENILIFLVAPFVTGLFLLRGESRRFVGFFLMGALVCLLSSYINSFVAGMLGMSSIEAMIQITPAVEEIMKALPLLFFMIVFIPQKETIFQCAVAVGIGFATFENCCYVITNGAGDITFVLIRGFAVGIMHVLCAAMLGFSLGFGDTQTHFTWLGVFASVAICVTYHSVYNLMISGGGVWQLYGYFMPFLTAVGIIFIKNLLPLLPKKP